MPEVTRMKLRSVLEEIDRAAPFALAADWDNVGLMVGDPDREVRRLGIALDPLPEAVAEAAERGCEALLTHHFQMNYLRLILIGGINVIILKCKKKIYCFQ